MGFTLTELMLATCIMVMAVAMASRLMIFTLRQTRLTDSQNKLDMDAQTAMENLKRDLRLTALDKMFFYSPNSASNSYTAMSWPLPADANKDGIVDLDSSNRVIWGEQVIYHVWSSSPDELRRTRFTNRLSTITDAQRTTQLVYVVQNGTGVGCPYESSSATTDVLFANLFNWSINPVAGRVDCYDTTLGRQDLQFLGSVVVSTSLPQVSFTVMGKNTNSSGYNLGIDNIVLSQSETVREIETQTLVSVSSGATYTNMDMSSYGTWGGGFQGYLAATATGKAFTISVPNDRYEDSDFANYLIASNATAYRDTTLKDYVVAINPGFNYRWLAYSQMKFYDENYWYYSTNIWAPYAIADAAPINILSTNGIISNACIRVLIRGDDMENAGISADAQNVYVYFYNVGTGPLEIRKAWISKVNTDPSGLATPDLLAITNSGSNLNMSALTFSGYQSNYVNWGGTWTDYTTNFPIEKEQSYMVSFFVATNWNGYTSGLYQFLTTNETVNSLTNTWIWPGSNGASLVTLTQEVWSTSLVGQTNGFIIATNAIVGVRFVYGSMASNGSFVSSAIDTHYDTPGYTSMTWNATSPPGTALSMYFRNATNENGLETTAWTSLGANPPAAISGNGRYCQYKAVFRSDSWTTSSMLKSVAINWPGAIRYNDLSLSYTKNTNCGICEVRVDGQPLRRAIGVSLEIFDNQAPVFSGTNRTITSSLTTEIEPRNSYKGQ